MRAKKGPAALVAGPFFFVPVAAALLAACHAGSGRSTTGPHADPEAALLAPAPALPVDPADPLRTYWVLPVRQPPGDRSTPTPEACGDCHPSQLADWRGSRHAHAAGPGFRAQMPLQLSPRAVQSCQICHQPLVEQQPWRERGELEPPHRTRTLTEQSMVERKWAAYRNNTIRFDRNPDYDEAFGHHGVTCAACHVRDGVVYGPPPGAHPPVMDRERPGAHAPAVRLPFFETAEFCAECHQFTMAQRLGETPIQNTYGEWLESPYGTSKVACVFCHMPDRRHLFRGIHDPDMVRGALAAETETFIEGDEVVAEMTLINQGAGHAMPTYITPRLEAHLELVDAGGEVVASEVYVIQRQAEHDGKRWIELSDTRLMPLRPVTFSVRAPVARVAAYRQRVEVDPDHFYRGFFERELARLAGDDAAGSSGSRALFEEAHGDTLRSRFVVHQLEERVAAPGQD